MATNPKDIRLTEKQRRTIARLADETGKAWAEMLDYLLSQKRPGMDAEQFSWLRAQESSLARVWDNQEDAIFDDL